MPRPLAVPLRVSVVAGVEPYVFTSPKILVFVVFMLLPLGWAILMTLQAGAILVGPHFVGLQNYAKVFSDGLFWTGLKNSFYYTVLVIPTVIVLGLGLSGLLNRPIRFRPFFSLLLIVPTVASTVAAAVVWDYLLQTDGGLFNNILVALGQDPVNWLGTPSLVMLIFVALEVWRGVGFYTMLFLAAMQSIPKHLYDAAAIDGATGLQAFRVVTLPLMRPAIVFATVMATIWNLQLFDSPYVMTKGGPGYASMTVVLYIYQMAFKYDSMGLAATMAFALLVIIMVLALLQLTLFRKEIQF
jgi:ABC-type sugar transport system permease subunit